MRTVGSLVTVGSGVSEMAMGMRQGAKKGPRHRGALIPGLLMLGVLMLGFGACARAQNQPADTAGKHPQPSHAARPDAPGHRHPRVADRREASREPPPQPPTVTLKEGRLTVTAENSDLGAILDDVAKLSGMQVDGTDAGAHVFGVYGPGNPRQVLTELLDGLGYNFMMVGDTTAGMPRELLLTAKSAAPVTPPAPSTDKAEASGDADDQEPPGPGAIVHVPPSVAQQADDSQTQERVQQNLERLEKMREQMDQQQQGSQPQ